MDLITPLGSAWRRMTGALFRPWRPALWFTVGLGAWLANLTNCGVPAPGFNPNLGSGDGGDGFEELSRTVSENLPFILAVAIPLFLVLVALAVVLLWLSSRGQFLFVDNVARGRAAVVAPWGEHGALANSLFWWRLGFGLVCLLAFGLTLTPLCVALFRGGGEPQPWVLLAVVPLMLALVVAVVLIQLYLQDFVVPIMFRQRLKALAAWGRFLQLFRRHPGTFLLYALWILLLAFGIGCAIFVLGCLTCCVGWLLLALPYLGTVLLLPVLYTYRAYSLELLARLAPEYDCFEGGTGLAPTSS